MDVQSLAECYQVLQIVVGVVVFVQKHVFQRDSPAFFLDVVSQRRAEFLKILPAQTGHEGVPGALFGGVKRDGEAELLRFFGETLYFLAQARG